MAESEDHTWDINGFNSPLYWWTKIPSRVMRYFEMALFPLRVFVLILDGIVAFSLVGILVVVLAWWTHHISDEQVAVFLSMIGDRLLGILTKSGVITPPL